MKGRIFFGLLTALCLMFAFDVGAAIVPAQHRPTTVMVLECQTVEIDMLNEENHAATCELVNTLEAVSSDADRFYRITSPRWRALNKDAIPDNAGSTFIYLQTRSLYRTYSSSGGLAGR